MGLGAVSPRVAPYWPLLASEALQPENLPRVLASMGFDRYLGSVARGTIRWWPPEYSRPPSLEALRAYPREIAEAFIAARRADLAPVNRALRDSPVHLLSIGERVVCIDEFGGEGEWRTNDGANRGPDILTLGAWRWHVPLRDAGQRLAHVLQMQVPMLKVGP